MKKDDFQTDQKQSVLERYGGEEHLDAPPKELLLAQTEEYVEYSRSGNVVKGQERAVAKSRYEEDVFTNNHTVSVIGREGGRVGGKGGRGGGREKEGERVEGGKSVYVCAVLPFPLFLQGFIRDYRVPGRLRE